MSLRPGAMSGMSEQVDARDVQVDDVIPNVGKVTEVVRTPDEVALTTFWSGSWTHRLAPDHPVWVNRSIASRVVRVVGP